MIFLDAIAKAVSSRSRTIESLKEITGGEKYEIEAAIKTLLSKGEIFKFINTEDEEEYCRPEPAITRDSLMSYITGVGCACTYEISKHHQNAHMGYIDSMLWEMIQSGELISLEIDSGEGITAIYMLANAKLTWHRKGSSR